MAILFNGVVMSHYTHFNLSSVTQITMQQTLRTLSLMAETSIFAYLGLAIFSYRLSIQPALIVASLGLCLAGRAANIYPLSELMNHFREHRITKKMQVCEPRKVFLEQARTEQRFEPENRDLVFSLFL